MQGDNREDARQRSDGGEGAVPADLPARVFDALFARIIDGSLRSGDRLPSERALTEQFGVNRQVVREALKRLAQLGLITADRSGNVVGDWRRTGSFDLVPLLVAAALGGHGPDPLLTARHLLEVRLAFALAVSQLCITHASDDQLQELVAVATEVAETLELSQRITAEWRVWSLAAASSGNTPFILLLNSLRHASEPALLLMARASNTVPGDPAALVAAARAMAARDEEATDLAIRHLYRIEPTEALLAAEEQAPTAG